MGANREEVEMADEVGMMPYSRRWWDGFWNSCGGYPARLARFRRAYRLKLFGGVVVLESSARTIGVPVVGATGLKIDIAKVSVNFVTVRGLASMLREDTASNSRLST